MSPFTRAFVAALTLFAAIANARADAPARTAAPAPWSAGFTLEKNGETLQVLDAQGHVVVGGLEGFFPNARYALLLRQSQWGVLRADGHILLAPEYARVEHLPESQLLNRVAQLSHDEKVRLIAAYVGNRENRRHKPGRAFERIDYRFDVLGDYGAFRDLQRHRLLTIEWQRLSPDHGYVMPELVAESGVADEFEESMTRSATLYEALRPDYPEQAAYAISMAYRLRYSMQFNAREAIHLLELRSAPQGHPAYRRVVIEMHRLIAEKAGHRAVADAMTHMTFEAPALERLDSERKAENRRNS